MQKIDNIRNNFTLTTKTEETLPQDIKFDQFRPVSIDEIRKVITSYNSSPESSIQYQHGS